MKHPGPVATRALTGIFNFSIQQNIIPNIWKLGKKVHIIKPTKAPTKPSFYRQLSLLCNPLKILERQTHNVITPNIILSPSHLVLRAKHSTAILLTTLTQQIHEGLNAQKPAHRTLLTTIEISEAFDTVPRKLLIQKIERKKKQHSLQGLAV